MSGRRAGPGPAVVAVGGGHGLEATLRAACRYAARVTAVVATADDGGSSGRLREALGVPPPGDLRRCVSALADPSSPWATALEHRFDGGELGGHALGNVMIAGLTEATGDLVAAVDEVARVAGLDPATRRVLPATRRPVVIKAHTVGAGTPVTGQVAIERAGAIRGVALVPADAEAPADAVAAIEAADQVVLGPGSLYTSVLAAAIVPGVHAAIARTGATRVYVCNLGPGGTETAGYTAADHLGAVLDHHVAVDVVVVDPAALPPGPLGELAAAHGVRVVEADVAAPGGAAHDPAQLAAALADLVG